MSAMIYYTEEIYLIIYTYAILTAITFVGAILAIIELCIKRVKEKKAWTGHQE